MIKILIVDDDKNHRRMLKANLEEQGYFYEEAENGKIALDKLNNGGESPRAILLDARMPVMDGFETLRRARQDFPTIPIIMMTAYSDISDAVDAIRLGAFDYQTKPLDITKLKLSIENAVGAKDEEKAREEKNYGIIGESRSIRELLDMIAKIGPTNATTLIQGESGAGKELVARAIHKASGRREGPFVAVNCGALAPSLAASELFGHEKGAFTGADRKRPGLFLEADRGSIFLDEIGETPPDLQVKLLRALQEREVLPVGGRKPIPINCRIIAATNRDLAEEVKKGAFREDLYYRLNVISLNIPPLRERKSDIPLLAREFAKKFATANGARFEDISSDAIDALSRYDWPGNARELENVMERAIILMPGEYIGLMELPEHIRKLEKNFASDDKNVDWGNLDNNPTLEEIEKKVILSVLKKVDNNKSEAARLLGIARKTLHTKLNRYSRDDMDRREEN